MKRWVDRVPRSTCGRPVVSRAKVLRCGSFTMISLLSRGSPPFRCSPSSLAILPLAIVLLDRLSGSTAWYAQNVAKRGGLRDDRLARST